MSTYFNKRRGFIFTLACLLYGCTLFEKEFIQPLPVAIEANQVTAISFKARWKKVTGASSYEIDVALDKEFTTFVPNYQDRKVDSTSLLTTNLEANTTYYYRIRANISNQTSQNSNIIEITTQSLDVPVVYPATAVSSTGFRIHWKKMPVVTNYQLDVATDEGFRKPLDGYFGLDLSPKDTHLLVSNVKVNLQYFYRVRVKQSNSFSEYSNIQSVFTSTLPRPKVLPATKVQLTSFMANWELMSEAVSYRVDVAKDALFKDVLPGYNDLAVTINNVVVPNLDANTLYYYRVRAVNDDATSNHSDIISVTTQNLAAPVATTATDIQSGSFQANWDKVNSAASYLLDVALDQNFTQILPGYNALATLNNSIVIQPVDASTTYFFRVRAQGLNATSDYSNTVQVTTGLLPAPVATTATSPKAFGFTANWQVQPDINLYLLDISTDASFTNFVTGYQAKEVIGNSLKIENLDFRSTYYYRLRSKRLNKLSTYSNTVQVLPCISPTCKVAKLEFFFGGFPDQRDQSFTYDAQNRLTTITYTQLTNSRYTIDYNPDNTVQRVVYHKTGSVFHTYFYNYSSGKLSSVQKNDASNKFKEIWTFSYNAQGQRISWNIYSDATKTTLASKFDYTYDTKGNVTEVKDKDGTVIRRYDYDNKLSPYVIFDENLCFFIANNRDNWTDDFFVSFDETEFRGFLPINNIKKEVIPTSTNEVFIFNYNDKDIATNQDAFYSAKYTFTGCGF